MSFHIPLHSSNVHRVSQASSGLHKTSLRVHRLPLDLFPRKFPPTYMETSIEANSLPRMSVEADLLRWKFPWKSVEADLRPRKLVEASMEVHGSFHCRWKWKLPLLLPIAASTDIFRGSVHELLYTPTYSHLLPRVSQTPRCFRKHSIRVQGVPSKLLP